VTAAQVEIYLGEAGTQQLSRYKQFRKEITSTPLRHSRRIRILKASIQEANWLNHIVIQCILDGHLRHYGAVTDTWPITAGHGLPGRVID